MTIKTSSTRSTAIKSMRLRRILPYGLALTTLSLPLHADELDVAPYLSAAFTYDDNVYLLADEEDAVQIIGQDERSDTIVDIAAGIDGKYSSMTRDIRFGARLFRQDYNEFSVLDFTGGTANFKGEWKLSKRWTTNLGYRYDRDQSNFSEENLAQGDVFDQHRAEAGLTLHVGENKDIYVKGAFRDKDYDQRLALANERSDISIGYRQFSRKNSSIGLELGHAEGDYPNRLSVSDAIASLQDYTEDSVMLVSEWRLGEKTRVQANVGYVDRQHNDALAAFDYDGLVFDVDLEWDVSAKTQFTAQLTQRLRDTENTRTLFNKERRLKLGFEWSSSEKLMFDTALTLLDLEFIQQGQNREDTGGIFEIGASYDFNRRSSIAPRIRIRSRDSNDLNSEYDNSSATINFQYLL